MSTPLSRPGLVLWITGYSGSGKTTIAHALQAHCRSHGMTPLVLDGDKLRAIFGAHHGYSDADRRALAGAYGRLCAELSAQGSDVICATISMFDEVRGWNRSNIPGYREIYLRVPLAERRARDPKGLYRARAQAPDSPMVGLDQHLDEPRHPDLTIDNHGDLSVADAVQQIWTTFLEDRTS